MRLCRHYTLPPLSRGTVVARRQSIYVTQPSGSQDVSDLEAAQRAAKGRIGRRDSWLKEMPPFARSLNAAKRRQ